MNASHERSIAILHYSAPPVVGGVEITIYHHARLLAEAGYAVQVIAGRGQAFHPGVRFNSVAEVDSRHPDVLAVKEELDRGEVSARFHRLRQRIVAALRPHLSSTQVLIAHNMFTLHKNLALTAALYKLLVEEQAGPARVLAWHHDLAWRREQYVRELHAGYPWQLLREAWPGVTHVAVSQPRRCDVAELYGIAMDEVAVVPPGVDHVGFLHWTELTQRIVQAYDLSEADLVLLLPARITRRKNIELAVRSLACLRRETGLDARLLVTGPPGPHNPANLAYLDSLLALRRELGLAGAAHFVYELGGAEHPVVPQGATMVSLYLLADALLFPSQEEGFGIPLLEAGLTRLPVFCSRIPPLQATGGMEVHYFEPDAEPSAVAQLIACELLTQCAFRLRQRVLKEYTWERIVRDRVIPLLDQDAASEQTG